MRQKKLHTTGNLPLTIKQANRGIQTCLANAKRLTQAAEILAQSKFFETASFILYTALEEVGKAFLLMEYQEDSFEGKEGAERALRESFRNHKSKLKLSIKSWKQDEILFKNFLQLNPQELSIPEILNNTFENVSEILEPIDFNKLAKEYFKKRNELLYTELKGKRFLSPNKQATRQTYKELLNIMRKVTARAAFNAYLGEFSFRHGGSRTQIAHIIKNNWPSLLAELKKLKN